MDVLRHAIKKEVHKLVGKGVTYDRKDEGLFGPGSVCWKVHGDFTTMMVGGVAALLLQMLHPAALAGVWEHSQFKRDMAGRLKRTAGFISATTYGDTAHALAEIERVRNIHRRVEGVLPDGSRYRASDPELLTWVHAAEVSCFLNAYVRYRNPLLSPADQDRYFAEVAEIAVLLGAEAVPRNRREVADYFARVRPGLRLTRRTHVVARALLDQRSNAFVTPMKQIMQNAAIDLLPVWAAKMHGFDIAPARIPAIRAGVFAVGSVLRWGLR